MLKTLLDATDSFLREKRILTSKGPLIRSPMDLKRWMFLVVLALVPCLLMAIWNTGFQSFVYGSGDPSLIQEYLSTPYFTFALQGSRPFFIIKLGLFAVLPVMFISYAVGGFWEALFATLRRHEISEGFLVSGMLFTLILPPTIPYWMVAVGVSLGIILSKELFGGTGMNILNPALLCRCILFFSFPTKMTGDVWIGTNPTTVRESLVKANVDGISQVSPLGVINASTHVSKLHLDAIGMYWNYEVKNGPLISYQLKKIYPSSSLINLQKEEFKTFLTNPVSEGGLGLPLDSYETALALASLKYAKGLYSNQSLFFGNKIGSMGETSTFAAILGAIFLIYLGIASWRTMLAVIIGALGCAALFQWGAQLSPYTPAKFDLPFYKHLLLGGLAFGLVFMATDPVTSPSLPFGKWLYGITIGSFVIIIRLINPAFPEGVMLAILFGNVFAPLFDTWSLKLLRRGRYERTII